MPLTELWKINPMSSLAPSTAIKSQGFTPVAVCMYLPASAFSFRVILKLKLVLLSDISIFYGFFIEFCTKSSSSHRTPSHGPHNPQSSTLKGRTTFVKKEVISRWPFVLLVFLHSCAPMHASSPDLTSSNLSQLSQLGLTPHQHLTLHPKSEFPTHSSRNSKRHQRHLPKSKK